MPLSRAWRLFTSALSGIVPASGGGTTNFLRADGTWNAPAGGGGSGTSPQQLIANNYYWTTRTQVSTGNALSTTVTRYTPFPIYTTATLSAIICRCTTAAGNVQFAIYANGTNNEPTGAALASTASTALSAAVMSVPLISNVQLASGWYWIAHQVDNATSIFLSVPNAAIEFAVEMGMSTLANMSSSATSAGPGWVSTSTYGTFATSPTITEASDTTAKNALVGYKVASVP